MTGQVMLSCTAWRLLMLLCCLLPGLSRGAPEAATLRIVGTRFAQIYEPGPNGQPRGLAVDLLRLLLADMRRPLQFEITLWPRAQLMVERGEAQILVGPYRPPERERRFLFTRQAFYQDPMLFLARRGHCWHWPGLPELLPAGQIAAVQGWAYGDAFDAQRARLQVTVARDLEVGLKMLALGRVELLACNERNAGPLRRSLGLDTQLEACPPAFSTMQGYFTLPRNEAGAQLRERLDTAMQKLSRSPQWRELAQRWQLALP